MLEFDDYECKFCKTKSVKELNDICENCGSYSKASRLFREKTKRKEYTINKSAKKQVDSYVERIKNERSE